MKILSMSLTSGNIFEYLDSQNEYFVSEVGIDFDWMKVITSTFLSFP